MSPGPLVRVRRALGRVTGAGPPPAGPDDPGEALPRVRVAATRVALISTAIVAAVYLLVSLVVVLIVTARDTAGVDTQLSQSLAEATANLDSGSLARAPGSAEWYWLIATDGTQFVCDPQGLQCQAPTSADGLPAPAAVAATPQTVEIGGNAFRVVGAATPPVNFGGSVAYDPLTGAPLEEYYTLGQLVIGQPLSGVSSAQGNVILAETIVGPILLLAVFLGALTIGRRVAAPIEQARVRQMEFTADASHELRTPLSVIEAQTSLALAQPRDVGWYRAAFQRVQGESGRMRRLVEDLLWLARFDSTRDRTQAEHVDVAVLAHMAADRFTAVAEARSVRLTVRAAPVPLVVHAPPDWMDRLLGVLLDNASKYVPVGGSIDVLVWADGNRVRLTVDDSGPGIPADQRAHIFDRFRRATDRPGGAGLGLAIANSVVSATGGRWQIGDSPAGGASMGVSWPRSLSGPPGSADAVIEPPSPPIAVTELLPPRIATPELPVQLTGPPRGRAPDDPPTTG